MKERRRGKTRGNNVIMITGRIMEVVEIGIERPRQRKKKHNNRDKLPHGP